MPELGAPAENEKKHERARFARVCEVRGREDLIQPEGKLLWMGSRHGDGWLISYRTIDDRSEYDEEMSKPLGRRMRSAFKRTG